MNKKSFALWLVLALVAFVAMVGGCGGGGGGDVPAPTPPSAPADPPVTTSVFDGFWNMTSGTIGYTSGASYSISGYLRIATISSSVTITRKNVDFYVEYFKIPVGRIKEEINFTVNSENKISGTASSGDKWVLEYLPHSQELVLNGTGAEASYINARFSRGSDNSTSASVFGGTTGSEIDGEVSTRDTLPVLGFDEGGISGLINKIEGK
jgi:hypothetical protein